MSNYLDLTLFVKNLIFTFWFLRIFQTSNFALHVKKNKGIYFLDFSRNCIIKPIWTYQSHFFENRRPTLTIVVLAVRLHGLIFSRVVKRFLHILTLDFSSKVKIYRICLIFQFLFEINDFWEAIKERNIHSYYLVFILVCKEVTCLHVSLNCQDINWSIQGKWQSRPSLLYASRTET